MTSNATETSKAIDIFRNVEKPLDTSNSNFMVPRVVEAWDSACYINNLCVLATVAAAHRGDAAAAAKMPPLVHPVAGEEAEKAREDHLHSGCHGGLNGDTDKKPPLVRVAGAGVKKAPKHRRRGGRGGMNGCNLFKHYKKYCIIKGDLTLEDFISNLFVRAMQVRNKSVCKSSDRDLASAGPGGINARLVEMWKDLPDEQQQEFNDRATEIKTRAADALHIHGMQH